MDPNNQSAQTPPPVVPEQQPSMAPQPTPMQGMAMPAKKKPNLPLIIGAIAGAVVLIAIILVVALTMGGVNQKDYKEAYDVTEEAKTAYNKIASFYLSPTSTETEVKNATDTIRTSHKTFNEKFDKLAKMKAVNNDKTIKEKFEKAKTKKPNFDKAMTATLESYDKILPVMSKYSSRSSSDASYSDLRKSLESISGLESEVNKNFVSKAIAQLRKVEDLYIKYQEGLKDYKKYDSKVSADYYAAKNELSKIGRDWESDIKKLADDGEMRDDMSAVSNDLFEKSLNKK